MEHDAATAPAWAVALEASPLAVTLRESIWLYPTVECLHIIGFALLVGSIAAFDVRIALGPPAPEVRSLARRLLPVSIAGFLLAAPAGLLLLLTEITAYLANPAFLTKVVLVAVALGNVVAFHLIAYRPLRRGAAELAPAGRAMAGLSLLTWLAVLVCGRLIAYV